MSVATPAYDVMLFRFEGIDTARRVLRRIKDDHQLDGCEIEGEAFVEHDERGKVHYHEKGSAVFGAAVGGVTATLVGVVGGPVVLLALAVGAGLLGGVAGHYAGQIIPGQDLKELGETLPPGSSAYVAVIDKAHAHEVAAMLLEEGATVTDLPVDADISSAVRRSLLRRPATV